MAYLDVAAIHVEREQLEKVLRRKHILILGVLGMVATGGLVLTLAGLFVARAWWTTPFETLGFGAAPEQPVAFPHTVHAGDGVLMSLEGHPKLNEDGSEAYGLGMDCTYCHRNVDKGAVAGVPPVEQCINCHKAVGGDLPEVMKVIDAWDSREPLAWERVHRLPDHVRFVHEAHMRFFTQPGNLLPSGEQALVASDVCSTCHGDVASMAEVKQVRSLKMGDCIDCHRDHNAPTDCVTCHY